MSIHKVIAWTAVGLWMALIFSLSHQPASESSGMSSGITEVVIAAVEQVVPSAQENFSEFEHIVRKNAHFLIYLILGILLLHAIRKSGSHSSKGLAAAFGIAVLYAMSDEFHQLFISGRSGEIRDVIIDSTGAAVGIIGCRLSERFSRRNSRKILETQEMQS